ncbi:aminopeptidase P family protein [Mangrovivirga cuniculi]|nr:aminopeptidase P family protein [Mangrovivirga cuniculi]
MIKPVDYYRRRRAKLISDLESSTLAVFHSNDLMPTNADGNYPFVQDSNLYYLTGILQDRTTLIIDKRGENVKEILYIRYSDEHTKIWEGRKLSQSEASEISGVEDVRWEKDLEEDLEMLLSNADSVSALEDYPRRTTPEVYSKNKRFVEYLKKEYPGKGISILNDLLRELRFSKDNLELGYLQEACNITAKGFGKVLETIRPGVTENELQGVYYSEFLKHNAEGFAYEPIIASGRDACVLHYVRNNKIIKEESLILMDVGAKYRHYSADLTRTVPASGRFTSRQKQIYNMVLKAQRHAFSIIRAGKTLKEINAEVGLYIQELLLEHGLLTIEDINNSSKEAPAYRKYFMHGTCHHLGIDTHDIPSGTEPLKENAVITVEPGLYLIEEEIGIRLENDVVVKKDGIVDLMADIPIEADHIEELMSK